ncbi:MAG: hypothetical protein AB7H93_21035 [Vicinamibacterales bacterium]
MSAAPPPPTSPRVTVVTVAFNAAATIRDTIDSVLALTCPDLDAGTAGAFNKGVRRAAGDYLHFSAPPCHCWWRASVPAA